MNEFVMPSVNLFGEKSIEELGNLVRQCDGNNVLIITDHNLTNCGITEKIIKVLVQNNILWYCFDQVQANPTKRNVQQALDVFTKNNCNVIIGLGGGSPNDCAKAVSILAANAGCIEDYVGFNQSKRQGIPLIAINTTAGTASEISRAYLITDEEKHKKLICKDIHALPIASINDPELMTGLPKAVTAATGMDALTHAVESYVCNNSYLLTKEIAASAIRLVFENLREVISDPLNIELRKNMIYAQSLAGMAFCNSGVGLAHAVAHALGAMYNMPHGLCTAMVLPGVMEINCAVSEELYGKLGKILFPNHDCQTWKEWAGVFIKEVQQLSNDVGTAQKLSKFGITENNITAIAEQAMQDGNIGRNPIMPSKKQIEQLLRNIL